ncbi:hypothetical protein LWI29_009421 [Acer saccharum]|uniref:Uncharacterized protein n=1 Tax=Acer saccharum TaxID=4024 RepID=A0AA39VB09_ACESA|nr:hypothetical protein LWI29_009421 [Acer saccharum]
MDQATETKNQVVDDDGGLKRTASRGSFQEPDAVPPADHGVANSVDLEAQPEPVGLPIPVVDPEAQHEQQAAADNDQEKLDWAVKMIVFCLPPAVAIAVQSLKTDQSHELPLAFHFLSVALILSFNSLFLSKFIAPREIAKLLERIGVFLAVTDCHFQTSVIYYCQIAISNTALSVQNFKADMAVPSALGLDPTVANSGVYSKKGAFNSSFLLSCRGSWFQVFQRSTCSSGECEVGALEAPTGCRRDYVPSADPGSRLPRMNIRVLLTSSSEEIISTLDLVSGDKIKLLLINAQLEGSYDLARSAFKVAEDFKVSIKLVNDVPSTLEISQLDIHIITTKDDYNRRYMKMLNLNEYWHSGCSSSHNLAWKIASAVKVLAPSSVLHTYETEHCHFQQSLVFKTSKQPWPFLLVLVSNLNVYACYGNVIHSYCKHEVLIISSFGVSLLCTYWSSKRLCSFSRSTVKAASYECQGIVNFIIRRDHICT